MTRSRHIGLLLPFLAALLLVPVPARAGHAHLRVPTAIPMRDAPHALAADVYLPAATGQWPAILIQTPYNKERFAEDFESAAAGDPLLESPDYVFVVLDWRGSFASADQAYAGSPNHGQDGKDAVDWVGVQPWCTGDVGTWGSSALGNVQMKTAAEQPEHLRCCVPRVYHYREWYDQCYPGGVYARSRNTLVYGLFGGLSLIRAHPLYDPFWTIAEGGGSPGQITVPMLHISGWFDHEPRQTIREMMAVQTQGGAGAQGAQKLLIGPWAHEGVDGRDQGEWPFPAAEDSAAQAALEFFDHHLRGIANGYPGRPTVRYYQINEDVWEESPEWPPAGASQATYYLTQEGGLTTEVPGPPDAHREYVSDPADPVPTLFGAVLLGSPAVQGPGDLTPLLGRDDVLVFSTEPLAEPLALAGEVRARLHVSCTAVDTDMCVRLVDVFPEGDGRSMLLVDGALRASLRNGFAARELLSSGEVYTLEVTLNPVAATIPAGHRLRVIVASSNYDLFDKNMQDGSNLSDDAGATPVAATVRLETNSQYPSCLFLPVMPGGGGLGVDFSASPAWGRPPLSVRFYGHVEGTGQEVVDWRWDFGDGTVESTALPHTAHVYDAPGSYTVSLTVTTAGGDAAAAVKEDIIFVSESVPVGGSVLLALLLAVCFLAAARRAFRTTGGGR